MLATLHDALSLLGHFDHRLLDIVGLSLRVSLSALVIGALVGLPFGAWLAVADFPGRGAVIVALNALMGLPSVVIGVLVYLALSRSGLHNVGFGMSSRHLYSGKLTRLGVATDLDFRCPSAFSL